MPVGISVWAMRGKERSQRMAAALYKGGRAASYRVNYRTSQEYRKPLDDIAAFYSYSGVMVQIFNDYRAAGRPVVFVDLGYWNRRQGGRWTGYQKVTVNSRHPGDYFMARDMPGDRLQAQGITPREWQKGGKHILVVGMSEKAAASWGMQPYEWEEWAIAELRKRTTRAIIYRPKPMSPRAGENPRPIHGAEMRNSIALETELSDCHAVVTHHSNVAIDALVAGVPTFCWDGAAARMSLQDISQIENPYRPKGRLQWLRNLAYCQWSTREISNGTMFRHLKSEGLIP